MYLLRLYSILHNFQFPVCYQTQYCRLQAKTMVRKILNAVAKHEEKFRTKTVRMEPKLFDHSFQDNSKVSLDGPLGNHFPVLFLPRNVLYAEVFSFLYGFYFQLWHPEGFCLESFRQRLQLETSMVKIYNPILISLENIIGNEFTHCCNSVSICNSEFQKSILITKGHMRRLLKVTLRSIKEPRS